jgi:cytochrome c553
MLKKSIITAALAFVATQTMAQSAAAPKGDPQAGANKNSMCIGCHVIPGYKASFPHVYHVPKISGQSAAYLQSSLQAYRKGDRPHPTMRAIAASLSDQDIADLAAYYAAR